MPCHGDMGAGVDEDLVVRLQLKKSYSSNCFLDRLDISDTRPQGCTDLQSLDRKYCDGYTML